jgi:uridine phosphorylase
MERKYFHDFFGGEASPGDIAASVILVNNPLSVDPLTASFDQRRSIANHYQFRVVSGIVLNRAITVCSTGIGGGSTSIAVDNLVRLGAKTLLYIDAGGSLYEFPGAYLATGAIRKDGASLDYVRPEFPAAADPEVLMACLAAGRELNLSIKPSLFWASAGPISADDTQIIERYHQNKPSSGRGFVPPIIVSGPEPATILTLSTIYRIRAGAIHVSVQNPEEITNAISLLFGLAVQAIMFLGKWDLYKESLQWKVMTPSVAGK